jgi:hypothetical protein
VWRRKRSDELESVNLLDVTPVRIAKWDEKAERVVLVRPKPSRKGLSGLVDRLLYLLSARRIRLDTVGSFAWLSLDGERTVGQVAAVLREKFGPDVEPAEDRLGHLVRVFHREGLVVYQGWDDDAIQDT